MTLFAPFEDAEAIQLRRPSQEPKVGVFSGITVSDTNNEPNPPKIPRKSSLNKEDSGGHFKCPRRGIASFLLGSVILLIYGVWKHRRGRQGGLN